MNTLLSLNRVEQRINNLLQDSEWNIGQITSNKLHIEDYESEKKQLETLISDLNNLIKDLDNNPYSITLRCLENDLNDVKDQIESSIEDIEWCENKMKANFLELEELERYNKELKALKEIKFYEGFEYI